MSDSPSSIRSAEDSGSFAGRGSVAAYPGTPRWVKVSAIVALVLVVLAVLVMVLAGGEHGPLRHMPSTAVDATFSAHATRPSAAGS